MPIEKKGEVAVTQPRLDETFIRIEPVHARPLIENGIQVMDVREPHEYAALRLPGPTLVPLSTLLRTPREFLKGGAVLFICAEGIRSVVACEVAATLGTEGVYNVEGGIQRWQMQGCPVESVERGVQLRDETPEPLWGVEVDFLISTERFIRVHRFRYLRDVGSACTAIDLAVEENMDEVWDTASRCMGRPDHPQQAPKAEFTVSARSVEAALRAVINKVGSKRAEEVFVNTG